MISIPEWAWNLIGAKRGNSVDIEAYPNQMLTITLVSEGVMPEKIEGDRSESRD